MTKTTIGPTTVICAVGLLMYCTSVTTADALVPDSDPSKVSYVPLEYSPWDDGGTG